MKNISIYAFKERESVLYYYDNMCMFKKALNNS